MVEVSPLLYAVVAAIATDPRPVEAAASVSAALGRRVTADNVEYLAATKLRPLGLMDDAAVAVPSRSTLALTLRAGVVPASVVRWLASGLRGFFLPPVVVVVLAAVAAFDTWLVSHGLGSALREVTARPTMTLTVIGLTLVGGAFHELGHAAASRYAGARPGVIGVGIYLLWPVFYNDLNDSYRLDRAGRLRCDLGGVYFNAVFVLVLGAVYSVTGGEILLLAVAVQHVAIVQQFLPFARLDGYYVISDLAGVPDLFRYVRPVLRSLRPGRPAPEVATMKPRVRAVVIAWVLVTVPLLILCAVVLIVRLPAVMAAAWRASVLNGHALVAGVEGRDPGAAAVALVSLVLVAVPFVGLFAAVAAEVRGRFRHPRAEPGAGPDVAVHAWADAVVAVEESQIAFEDRWDAASDLASSLLWLDPADRWLPLPDQGELAPS